MKIMIVSDLAPPVWGGAENYVVNLGSRLAELGHEVHWVTSKIPNTIELEVLDNIYIHRVPIIYPNRYFFPGRQSFSITSIIPAIKLARRMDIVQVNSLVAGFSGWVIAKYARKSSLLFCHELFGDLWKLVGQNFLEKYCYPLFERSMAKSPYNWFACPSEYSKKSLIKQGAPKNKITIIPHGTELQFNMNSNEDFRKEFDLNENFTIGYIGRLNIKKTAQSKNIKTLLKTVSLLSHEIPNLKLILGGKGFENLVPIIHELGIQEKVIYLGNVPYSETQNFYKACDVVICPALSDGFCFLLAEASACGIPTVATNLGAHPERVIHNKTGLLTSVEPEDLKQNVIKLFKDESLRKELGRNAQEYVKKFTWKESVKKHVEIYNKLIEQKQHKQV